MSQFEIFAAVRRRASPLRFPERRPAAGPLFPRAKPSPETRYGPFQEVPGRVDVAVNLDLAMRASFGCEPDRSFGTVRPNCEQCCEVFLASITANQPPALGHNRGGMARGATLERSRLRANHSDDLALPACLCRNLSSCHRVGVAGGLSFLRNVLNGQMLE